MAELMTALIALPALYLIGEFYYRAELGFWHSLKPATCGAGRSRTPAGQRPVRCGAGDGGGRPRRAGGAAGDVAGREALHRYLHHPAGDGPDRGAAPGGEGGSVIDFRREWAATAACQIVNLLAGDPPGGKADLYAKVYSLIMNVMFL